MIRCPCPCHQNNKTTSCGTCGNTGYIQKEDQKVGDVPITISVEDKPKFPIEEVDERLRRK